MGRCAARDGDLRAAHYEKVGMATATNGVHVTWLDDIKVVHVKAVAAVAAKTATGHVHLEVPNSRCWSQAV